MSGRKTGWVGLAAWVWAAGCGSTAPEPAELAPEETFAQEEAPLSGAVLPKRGGKLPAADGAPCKTGADCVSGVCEGLGCDGRATRCVPAERPCTEDLVEYCGCDGKVFMESGSCPGRPHQPMAGCQGTVGVVGKAAVGAACVTGADCASGVCEGPGCDGSQSKCVEKARACTEDLGEYCGCDGKIFMESGSCPGQPFAAIAACKAPGQGEGPGGFACKNGADCASGICEGQGCDGTGPRCRPVGAMCTKDLVTYCGCDGAPFMASGTCAGRPFAAKGPCAKQ